MDSWCSNFFFGLVFPVLVFPGSRFSVLDFSADTHAGELPVNTENHEENKFPAS